MLKGTQKRLQTFANKLFNEFSDIVKEVKETRQHPYEIADWVKREDEKSDILVYRVTATDKYISQFSVSEIYNDNSILFNFSKQEIKYISSLALLIYYKSEPKYQVIWESFRHQLSQGTLHIRDKDKPGVIKTNIDELEKNIAIIDQMSGRDAYLLGKEAGIRERLLEEKLAADVADKK